MGKEDLYFLLSCSNQTWRQSVYLAEDPFPLEVTTSLLYRCLIYIPFYLQNNHSVSPRNISETDFLQHKGCFQMRLKKYNGRVYPHNSKTFKAKLQIKFGNITTVLKKRKISI